LRELPGDATLAADEERTMKRADALKTLKDHEPELKRLGVRHAAFFGSLARGDAKAGSDIDILLDIDPTARISVFDYAGIVEYVQGLFPERVDIANRESLKPHVRPSAERDAVGAF
jgi:predicted nucleotidyltransferase